MGEDSQICWFGGCRLMTNVPLAPSRTVSTPFYSMSAAGSHGRYGKLGVKAWRHGGQIGDGLQVLREHVERPVGDLVVLGGTLKAGHARRIAHPLQQRGRLLQPREHPERGLAEAGSESPEPVHLDRGVAPRRPPRHRPDRGAAPSHAALPPLYPSQPGAPSRRPSRCCRASSAPRGPCGWSCCRTPSTSVTRATLSGWPVGDPGRPRLTGCLAGYARNWLHPSRTAVYATEPNILRHSLPYVGHLVQAGAAAPRE